MRRKTRILLWVFAISALFFASMLTPAAAVAVSGTDTALRVPTVEDLMNLKSAGGARISPDGTRVAYTVTETDFEQDAYELRQGLEDRGVPVEMVVYKGYGHGITKPKSMRAVMEHNLAWFNHYIFGDPRPDLSAPPVPKKTEKKEGGK